MHLILILDSSSDLFLSHSQKQLVLDARNKAIFVMSIPPPLVRGEIIHTNCWNNTFPIQMPILLGTYSLTLQSEFDNWRESRDDNGMFSQFDLLLILTSWIDNELQTMITGLVKWLGVPSTQWVIDLVCTYQCLANAEVGFPLLEILNCQSQGD